MLSRMIHTVRHLKPLQVYGRVYRPKPRLVGSSVAPSLRLSTAPWREMIRRESAQLGESHFLFLNQERKIKTWNDENVPKLWLYNLHYFAAPNRQLIDRWVAENPVGEGNGWEPYPLSLRIVNWIKWHLAGNVLDGAQRNSLADQARYLSQSIEYHLLGNHLFVNAKALVFAGTFFAGEEAERWLNTGLTILHAQIKEQVLSDGGHFERSPMYHALVLEDILDLVNLADAYGNLPQREEWATCTSRMLCWLTHMTHPDGRVSFFNDSAFGIAPELADLNAYAERLGIKTTEVTLGDSGYIRLANEDTAVVFDAAHIGPDYQPGHAHADTLSFELSHRGERVLVNSGTSTYENNSLRHRQRSTAAHNTATVDGLDSSEVWSAFRVARRARPLDVHTDHRHFAEAGHSGYQRLTGVVTHRRRLELEASELKVIDSFEGSGVHDVKLFFHLHPASNCNPVLDAQLRISIEATEWYPEFNASVPNVTMVGSWTGECPVTFVSHIPLP